MKFVLDIELGNAAMMTKHDIARALNETARKLPQSVLGAVVVGDYGKIMDLNGNTVGKWEVVK